MFLLLIWSKERDKVVCRKFILQLCTKNPKTQTQKKPQNKGGKKWYSLNSSVLEKEKCSLPRAIETSSEKCGENYQIIYQPGMYPPEKCFEKPGG